MESGDSEKTALNAFQAAKIAEKFVTVPESQVIHSLDEIKIKPPLVLKILSPDALHKTEVNGIRIVMYDNSLADSFKDLVLEAEKHKIALDGIMVQKYVKGIETIVGIKRDPVFGHMILFGLGGIYTEAIADTTTRKCPINLNDADEMINSLKSSKIFKGFRGMNVNLNDLKKSLVEISRIPLKHKNIEEMDINPFTLTDKKSFAVDVRIIEE
jgi:hypothetical protein